MLAIHETHAGFTEPNPSKLTNLRNAARKPLLRLQSPHHSSTSSSATSPTSYRTTLSSSSGLSTAWENEFYYRSHGWGANMETPPEDIVPVSSSLLASPATEGSYPSPGTYDSFSSFTTAASQNTRVSFDLPAASTDPSLAIPTSPSLSSRRYTHSRSISGASLISTGSTSSIPAMRTGSFVHPSTQTPRASEYYGRSDTSAFGVSLPLTRDSTEIVDLEDAGGVSLMSTNRPILPPVTSSPITTATTTTTTTSALTDTVGSTPAIPTTVVPPLSPVGVTDTPPSQTGKSSKATTSETSHHKRRHNSFVRAVSGSLSNGSSLLSSRSRSDLHMDERSGGAGSGRKSLDSLHHYGCHHSRLPKVTHPIRTSLDGFHLRSRSDVDVETLGQHEQIRAARERFERKEREKTARAEEKALKEALKQEKKAQQKQERSLRSSLRSHGSSIDSGRYRDADGYIIPEGDGEDEDLGLPVHDPFGWEYGMSSSGSSRPMGMSSEPEGFRDITQDNVANRSVQDLSSGAALDEPGRFSTLHNHRASTFPATSEKRLHKTQQPQRAGGSRADVDHVRFLVKPRQRMYVAKKRTQSKWTEFVLWMRTSLLNIKR